MKLEDKFTLAIASATVGGESFCHCKLLYRNFTLAVGYCTLRELSQLFEYDLGQKVHNGVLFPSCFTVLTLLEALNSDDSPIDIYLGEVCSGVNQKPFDDFQAMLDEMAQEISCFIYRSS